MVIKSNMLATFTSRQLNINEHLKATVTEKLSSGYKVNRAADDAAGLSISEKMRGQIRGLYRASHNAQDGISLLNVADGGLHEVQSILQRIRELAVQAANDTNVEEDRDAIQKEIEQLNEEVDRIGKSTEFNTIKVLQGYNVEVITQKTTQVTYDKHQGVVDVMGQGGQVECGKHYPLGNGTYTLQDGITVISNDPLQDSSGRAHYSYRLNFSVVDSKEKWESLDGSGFTFQCTLGCDQEFTFKFDKNAKGIKDETPNANIMWGGTENNKVFTVGTSGYSKGNDFVTELIDFISKIGKDGNDIHVGHDNLIASTNGSDLIVYGTQSGNETRGYLVIGKPEIKEVEIPIGENILNGKVLNIQAGANTDQLIGLILPHIDREELKMDRVRVTSSNDATTSIGYVDEMIETVSMARSRIGAYTNRLEHTYANADNMAENLQNSESRIRDANMADEIVDFTLRNILSQAAQAILTQANQASQGVLQLL